MVDLFVRHRLMVVLLSASLISMVGCAEKNENLGKVSGTITLDGEPLKHAVITFQPQGGRPAFGKTGEDGTYTMMYSASEAGATIGVNKVSISNGGERRNEETDEVWYQKEEVPPKYNARTELEFDVQPGTQTHDFLLESS